MILATVKGQSLKINHPKVVADTIAYLEMSVQFKTEDWNGLRKYVHFNLGEEHYSFELKDDKITKDMHLDLPEGEWEVYIHGALYNDVETVQRITTEPITLYVNRTGSLDGEPFPELNGSVGEYVIATAEKALKLAEELKEREDRAATPYLRINPETYDWEATYDGGETWYSLGIVTTGNDEPTMNGDATPGTSDKYSREDHVHPSDASKQDNLAFDGEYNAELNKVATVDTVARKIAEIVAGAPTDLDTLKELADYLATHGREAAEMNSEIKKNAEDIVKNAQAIEENAQAIEEIREDADDAVRVSELAISNATASLNFAYEANTISKETKEALTEHKEEYASHIKSQEVKDKEQDDALSEFKERIEALLASDDTTLDQLQEVVDYIKNNKSLIEGITTDKVNVDDIVNDLITTATNKPLSANQGRILKDLIDAEVSRATKVEEANAKNIADEIARAKEAEAKCVQQKAYSGAEYSPTFNDGDCARAYVRSLNGKEDSILVSKYTKPHALAMRDSNGKLFTLDPVDKNHCANKQYVDDTKKAIENSVDKTIDDLQDSLGETLAENLINPDYRENDASKKSHILNRPAFVGDGVESSNFADWSKNRYSFFLKGFNGGLHSWSEIGYPRDYYNADLIGDTMWAEKFLDDIARYSITVEQRTCRGSKDVTYYLSDATVRSDYGAYIIAVETDYYEDTKKEKLPLLVIYDRRTFNDHYYCSFPNEGVYLCEISFDHTSGGLHSDTLSTISLEKRETKKLPNALVDFAKSTFLQMNLLNFKRATVKPNGGTFLFTPGMLAIVFPWNNSTCSMHSPNGKIFNSIGTSVVFTTDRFNSKYYDIAAFNFSISALTSSSSHHNTYELTDSGGNACYIKNEYNPGTSGETGFVYVYYLERGKW